MCFDAICAIGFVPHARATLCRTIAIPAGQSRGTSALGKVPVMSMNVSLPVGRVAPLRSTLQHYQHSIGLFCVQPGGAWALNTVSVEKATQETSAQPVRRSITQKASSACRAYPVKR